MVEQAVVAVVAVPMAPGVAMMGWGGAERVHHPLGMGTAAAIALRGRVMAGCSVSESVRNHVGRRTVPHLHRRTACEPCTRQLPTGLVISDK